MRSLPGRGANRDELRFPFTTEMRLEGKVIHRVTWPKKKKKGLEVTNNSNSKRSLACTNVPATKLTSDLY